MSTALTSLIGLIVTAIALYGFYWVIRLAVRAGMLDAEERREQRRGTTVPAQPAPPSVRTESV